jgi:hypothetical protein
LLLNTSVGRLVIGYLNSSISSGMGRKPVGARSDTLPSSAVILTNSSANEDALKITNKRTNKKRFTVKLPDNKKNTGSSVRF